MMIVVLDQTQIDRRRDHLVAEISRPRQSAIIPLQGRLFFAAVSCSLALIVGVGALLWHGTTKQRDQSPVMLLASANTAVNRATNTVLHATQTLYGSNDPNRAQTTSEGWVDRTMPGVGRVVDLGPNQVREVDSSTEIENGRTIRKEIVYGTSTVHVSEGAGISLTPLLPDEARQVFPKVNINGVEAIHISGVRHNSPIDTWLASNTKLPIRVASITNQGLVVLDYQWLPRTAQSLATLIAPTPGGFTQTTTPLPANQQPTAPGANIVPVPVSNQTLQQVISNVLPNTTPTPTSTSTPEALPTTATTRTVPPTTTPAPSPTTTPPSVQLPTTTPATTPATAPPVTARPTTPPTVPPTTAPPQLTPYSDADPTVGILTRTCSTHTVGSNITIYACTGVANGSNFGSRQAEGNVQVYQLVQGKKYETADYLVNAIYINSDQFGSNGRQVAPQNNSSFIATDDLSQPNQPTTFDPVEFQYQVFKASDPTTPVATYTLTTSKQ